MEGYEREREREREQEELEDNQELLSANPLQVTIL